MTIKDKNKSKTHPKQPRIDEVKSFLNSSCIIKFIIDDIDDTRVHVTPQSTAVLPGITSFEKKPNNINTHPSKLVILVIKYNLLSLKFLSRNNILIVSYPAQIKLIPIQPTSKKCNGDIFSRLGGLSK